PNNSSSRARRPAPTSSTSTRRRAPPTGRRQACSRSNTVSSPTSERSGECPIDPAHRCAYARVMNTIVEHGRHVHANGIDIYYREQGDGPPLLLLHGGLVSRSPPWAGGPVSYASHLDTRAARHQVTPPDTRGCARTAHTAHGSISFALLADDVAALIGALELERPLIAGFSEGAVPATILGLRAPESVSAIVNQAGHD